MYVKSEPDCDFDINMELMTDMETSLLREELFGNQYVMSSGDVSESSSDDDLIQKLSSDLELPVGLDELEPIPPWPSYPPDEFDFLPNGNSSSSQSSLHSLNTTSTSSSPTSVKSEDDMMVDELTRALYPNMMPSRAQVVKEEPENTQHMLQMPPSPHEQDLWELLCDVKPSIKILDTPPVTPPQRESSPPHSPQPATTMGQYNHHNTPNNHLVRQDQKATVHLNGSAVNNHLSQPIKVVTITTRNGNSGPGPTKSGRVTKTMKIQPKVITQPQPPTQQTSQPSQIINIINSSSGTKLTLPKAGLARTLSGGNQRIVQVKTPSPPPPPPTTTATTTTPITTIPSILTHQVSSASKVGMTPTASPPAPPPTAAVPLTPLAPALTPGMKQGNLPDLKAFKRQQRMIKNRESASLSRKKKKEYLTSLESRISELQKENQKLKEENIRLHQKVSCLESECSSLRRTTNSRGSNRKTTTALFALIFLFSLNLGPLSGIFLGGKSNMESLKNMMAGTDELRLPSTFSQRSLLWTREEEAETVNGSSSNVGGNSSHTCPMMYFNATESLRLESELRDWFEHKFNQPKTERRKDDQTSSKKGKGRRKGLAGKLGEALQGVGKGRNEVNDMWNALAPPHPPPTHLYHYIHPEALHMETQSARSDQHHNNQHSAVVPSAPRLSSFLEAIQRRDDTYYVVSFSPDHLLVPATARNDSARPRMSLLMPTLRPINESLAPPRDHVALMQIDCEVMHTRLVHVSEEYIPPHLRAGGTNGSQPSQPPPQQHPSPDTQGRGTQQEHRRRGKARTYLNSGQPTQ